MDQFDVVIRHGTYFDGSGAPGRLVDVGIRDGRIAAIYRSGGAITPTGETIVADGDEVFVLAAEEHIRTVMRELRRSMEPVRRVMIAGGGNIGHRVAQALEGKCEVKLIEVDRRRAEFVANSLKSVLVLNGDATDEELLQQEGIEEMELFLALSNADEDNIMGASLAKRMGCQRVVALINRRAYAELVQGGPIDIAISPAQVSIGTLLTYVRHGDVVQVHSLRRGAAEALEIVAHGDKKNSRAVGRRVGELPVIHGAFIAAIVRDLGETEDFNFFRLGAKKQTGQVLASTPNAYELLKRDELIAVSSETSISCLRPVGLVAQAATSSTSAAANNGLRQFILEPLPAARGWNGGRERIMPRRAAGRKTVRVQHGSQ